MSSKINFVKMHGLGNDFVIINKKDLTGTYDLSQLAKSMAERHLGIGCDQFIIYEEQNDSYEMIIYNIDGSSAKLCGNATRCLAKLIYLDTGKKDITVVVGNKKLLCNIIDENNISVNVGGVSFNESWMPSRDKIWEFAERYMIDLKETICVDVGNPHLVIFSKLELQDQKIVGEKLQDKDLFIDGVNVNFAEVKDNKIYLSVWERGAGLTLACGSGACGSFAAGLKLGFIHSPCEVVFKHGSLIMKEENSNIIMQGPATMVAQGVYFVSNLKQEIVTFGCRLNIYESEIIRKNLAASGLDNVAVFNTCAVTKSAEKQARGAIRAAKKNNPDFKIIVTGCSAQTNPKMYGDMPEVDKVIGNEEKLLPSHYQINDEKIVVNDIMSVKETANHLISSFDGKSRAFIQVQNGCDHNCTFCIIPYGRGRSRSTAIGAIAEQVKHLVLNGFKEVVFTGVDATAYGSDLPGSPTFAQMIKRVLNLVPELKRLRLSSIDVAEINDELFELLAYNERIMPHFHISLQAGDDMILKRMKRRHNRAEIIEFCNRLRAIRPEVSFGADIIAGFPTETPEMFENTRKLIAEAELQYLHVFPYSEREGTAAARMPQVPKAIRKERAEILRQEGQIQLAEFFKKHIGQKVELLVENNNIAHTENFIPVKLDEPLEIGQIFKAKLVGVEDGCMKCILVQKIKKQVRKSWII